MWWQKLILWNIMQYILKCNLFTWCKAEFYIYIFMIIITIIIKYYYNIHNTLFLWFIYLFTFYIWEQSWPPHSGGFSLFEAHQHSWLFNWERRWARISEHLKKMAKMTKSLKVGIDFPSQNPCWEDQSSTDLQVRCRVSLN